MKKITLLFCALLICGCASSSENHHAHANTVSMVKQSGDAVIGRQKVIGPQKMSGSTQTETRNLSCFTSININAPVKILYKVSQGASVTLHASAAILPLLTTTIQNGQLVVLLPHTVVPQESIYIEATSPALESIVSSGNGDIEARDLEGKNLHIIATGNGNVVASGNIEKVDVNHTGSGKVDIAAVHAQELKIDVFGTGGVNAFASEKAHVHVMGEGDVNVAGNPKVRSTEPHGSGVISFAP